MNITSFFKLPFYVLFFMLLVQISAELKSQSIDPERIEYRYWIYFKDKGNYKKDDPMPVGGEAFKTALSELNDKAIWRRSKVLKPENLVSYEDLPVYSVYIQQIKELGLMPHAVSKWFNAVSIRGKKKDIDAVKKLPFVDRIEGVHFIDYPSVPSNKIVPPIEHLPQTGVKYNYGLSYWQNAQIKVPELHNIGVTGYNVTIGMCDDGFDWRRHKALYTRKVLGVYDWIYKDDSVQNQWAPNQIPSDTYDQDGHGTSTMSTIGGFLEGSLIGPAFDAEFWLSKTEYGATETPPEEDYWLEAVEWMESKGIEVISSSLIYKPFDKPNNSYDYKDMNGRTTVIVRAAEHCAYLGIVVCNSMGNEYQTETPSIVSPGDGDSVIAVGAVDSSGHIAYFSSNGPTSDGRTKPDVVAMGEEIWAAVSTHNTYNDTLCSYTSGTSFSCPLTAGVCALILSVHPELTPMQVRDALRNTADRHDKPDNVYGWGLINAYEAALYHGMIMSNKPELITTGGMRVLSVYVLSKKVVDPSSVKIFYATDENSEFKEAVMNIANRSDDNNSGRYTFEVPAELKYNTLKFYFTAADTDKNISVPYKSPDRFFYMKNDSNQIELY